MTRGSQIDARIFAGFLRRMERIQVCTGSARIDASVNRMRWHFAIGSTICMPIEWSYNYIIKHTYENMIQIKYWTVNSGPSRLQLVPKIAHVDGPPFPGVLFMSQIVHI
jgi:hypothetical protein